MELKRRHLSSLSSKSDQQAQKRPKLGSTNDTSTIQQQHNHNDEEDKKEYKLNSVAAETMISSAAESEASSETVANLPQDLIDTIPRDYSVSDIRTFSQMDYSLSQQEQQKTILRTDEDNSFYSFQLQFKLPGRIHHPQFVSYPVIAFKFNMEHVELQKVNTRLNLKDLRGKWIIIPDASPSSQQQEQQEHSFSVSSESQFYRALVNFGKHWDQWLEENVSDDAEGKDSDDDSVFIEDRSHIVRFQRFIWPDDSCFLTALNSVAQQRRRSSVVGPVLSSSGEPDFNIFSRTKSRQKRRRSIVQEDLTSMCDERVWSRYIVMEFASDYTGSENLICVHDMSSGITKSKIQRTLPERSTEEKASSQEGSHIYMTYPPTVSGGEEFIWTSSSQIL